MKFPDALTNRARGRRPALLLAGLALALAACAVIFFARLPGRAQTFYVAYVGRYERHGFDRLHELALRKYLEEMNAEARGGALS